MIAGLSPELMPGEFVFCAVHDIELALDLRDTAIASFREAEGISLILPIDAAQRAGMDVALPMRMITLKVYSALGGVGLTAAVASALASRGIACNMVAAFCHDHVFVPSEHAQEAMDALRELQRNAAPA